MDQFANMSFPSDSSSDDEEFLLSLSSPEQRHGGTGNSSESSLNDNRSENGLPDTDQVDGDEHGSSNEANMEIGSDSDGELLSIHSENTEEVENAPVSSFHVSIGPDGQEVFEFVTSSDELSEDDSDDWRANVGVEPAPEFALPENIISTIAQRVRARQTPTASSQSRSQQPHASTQEQAGQSFSNGGSATRTRRPRRANRRPRTKRRRMKKTVHKKKAPRNKVPKPQKPLGPIVLDEDWDGNDKHKEYLKKISSTKNQRVVINIQNFHTGRHESRSPQNEIEVSPIHSSVSNDKNDRIPQQGEDDVDDRTINNDEAVDISPHCSSSEEEFYKIGQVLLDRSSIHNWRWRNKQELPPEATDLILYVNDRPGFSILHLKMKKVLRGETLSERKGPPPKLSKRNSERELVYNITQHYFYHVEPVGIPVDLFGYKGLANKKNFMLDFNSFDMERQCFLIDVVLLQSSILGDHDVHEIPTGRSALLQEVYSNFLGITPPSDPDELEAKQKEDIEWFYGQIKKYHQKEELPSPDISLQPPSLKPTLRKYQSDAVNWMLYREGCLDHCIAHSSSAYLNRVDLITSFLNKMYFPVRLKKHFYSNEDCIEVETKEAFYNPHTAYICWKKPSIPVLPRGGILCDEMGLGKTVETLCLILLNQKPTRTGNSDVKPISFENEDYSEESLDEQEQESTSDSDYSEDYSNKRGSKKRRKKESKMIKKNAKSKLVPRYRKRASSPCEFVAADDGCSDHLLLETPSLVPKRRLSSSTTNVTALEAVEAKLKAHAKEKLKQNTKEGEQQKPFKTFDALKILYDSALNNYKFAEMAKSTPKFHGRFYETKVERREFFECICGDEICDSRKIVKCSICHSSQHAECIGFDTHMKLLFKELGKSYLCPHCESLEPPFETKATLIITPQSISHQWIQEIQRHVQHNRLNILFYKGVSVHGYIPPAKLGQYDLVITTYNVLSSELNYVNLPHCNSADGRRFRNAKRFLTIPSPLPSLLWWRICLDEAQMVEGIATKMSNMARRLEAVHRWCITGTPMNKGLQDLFGLFIFLRIYPISYDFWWNVLVRDPFFRKETDLLYELFGQTIWRNGKQDVLDQLGIPPQTDIVHWLNFSPIETHFYKQQFEIASQRIMEKIRKLQRSSPEVDVLNFRLSSLDRFILHGLLAPFLELRQACCHPQIVKGQLISLQKGTMSMEELLDRLVKKTQLQCHEDHRLVIAALNGMAGLHILLNNWVSAAAQYREVLQSAEKHKDHFQTDSLQLLHAMENLAEILDANHDGIPFTLRDESLRSDAAVVRQKYMKKYSDAVKSAQDAVAPLSLAVEETHKLFTMKKESWWVSTLKAAQKMLKIEPLIQSLKQDLQDVTKKNMKNTQSIANKFNDRYSLEHALIPNILGMDSMRESVLEGLEELQNTDPAEFVESAIRCHLRQKSSNYYNDSRFDDSRCKLCMYHDNFLMYESTIFKTDLKNKIDRTGRNFQQRKLLGELADELTQKTKDELLQQEADDLRATTEHVQLINEELRRGTWGDSETEVLLKGIFRFAKINKLPQEITDGGIHIKLLEAVKKEFRFLRILWRQIFDQVSALDELSQATTRLIAVRDMESGPMEERPTSSRNIKELRSGIAERTLKIQNIHVIGFHEIEPKLEQMQGDFATGQDSLSIHLGQLLYLKTLKRNGYGKKGTMNTEDCPICSTQLGKEWSVLRCGHSFCSDCVKKMCPNALQQNFLCPLCRHSMKFADVSFVDTTENEDPEPLSGNETKKVREIRGSHSTKVGAIVETLLQLQETHPGEKCIIFSTWSDVLDIIATALGENDIKYCSLNQSGRSFHTNLEKFKTREDLQVLLMPLISGSKGLNIIEATHVLLVEPILNLASELQAIGRVHRIGQMKPTFVHRFYIKRTIEEKLFKILKGQDISSDDEGSLTVKDLKTLVSSAPTTSSVTLD